MQVQARQLVVSVPGLNRPVLSLAACDVPKGGRLLITGQSGAGKTTLLHLLAGLMLPAQGEVLLDGQDTRRLSEAQRTALRRDCVGLVFQRLNLLDHLSAHENVLLGLEGGKGDEEKAQVALEALHLAHRAHVLVSNLSLGEQQRVAVARALAKKPPLILADEPTSSLDARNTGAVVQALLAAHHAGATLVVASHDERLLRHFEETQRLHLHAEGVL